MRNGQSCSSLARGGQTYARLRFNVGPAAEIEIPVSVDYSRSFGACEHDAWEDEYLVNVLAEQPERGLARELEPTRTSPFEEEPTIEWYDDWFHYVADGEDVEEVQV